MNLRRTLIALTGALITALALPSTGMAVTGQVTEFPIPGGAASAPHGIAAGPDGNVWFTESAAPKIGKITPAGVITDFPVAGGTAPEDIAAGPNNTLWMVDKGANKLFKVDTTTGTSTVQTATVVSPNGIAAGPDGDIWVANQGGTVQKVKPDGSNDGGAITAVAVGNLQDIAKGPDNNMWVSDFNGGLIRITTGGVATPINIGTTKNPRGVVAGPDGKVYFTETAPAPGGNKIGHVNTDGTGLQETSGLTGGASDPEGIAVGQDGNLYVAIFNGSQIGQVTPALGLTQFSSGITANSGPRWIAKGADGNMWFTEETAGKIGRFTVDPPPTPTTGGGGTTTTTTTTTTTPTQGPDTSIPQVSNVLVKPDRFIAGPTPTAVAAAKKKPARGPVGTTITFMLTKDATATLSIEQALPGRKTRSGCGRVTRANRKAKKCTRYKVRGTLTRTGLKGENAVPFSGRIGQKRMPPGKYRVGVSATDSLGQSGLPQYANFTILAPGKAKGHR
jgi:streptogramin lyase